MGIDPLPRKKSFLLIKANNKITSILDTLRTSPIMQFPSWLLMKSSKIREEWAIKGDTMPTRRRERRRERERRGQSSKEPTGDGTKTPAHADASNCHKMMGIQTTSTGQWLAYRTLHMHTSSYIQARGKSKLLLPLTSGSQQSQDTADPGYHILGGQTRFPQLTLSMWHWTGKRARAWTNGPWPPLPRRTSPQSSPGCRSSAHQDPKSFIRSFSKH